MNRAFARFLALFALTACAGSTRGPAPAGSPTPLTVAVQSCGAPPARAGSLAEAPVTDGAAVFDTAWTIIRRTHWDTTYNGVNWTAVRDELRPKAAAARTRGELRQVLGSMVARLKQSHFSIIPQEVAEASSVERPDAAVSEKGSGTVGFDTRLDGSAMIVSSIDTGGPAWSRGVRTGWEVVAVGGCPLSDRLSRLSTDLEPRRRAQLAWQTTAGLLSGLEGDTLHVTFRDGSNATRAVVIALSPATGTVTKFGNLPAMNTNLAWQRVQRDGRTIGIIRFDVWMPVLAAQFDAAIDSLRNADGIVLDLRGNPGGVGGMSMGFAGHFLDSAVSLGEMQQRGGTMLFRANPRRVDTRLRPVTPFAGPLALVLDAQSGSTTEIFAGGLQALGRATVFGARSAGQALPSVPEKLPNGDILYHAIANFVGPTGKPVEGDGVTPNQLVPVDRQALLRGKDAALDAAIGWTAQRAPQRIHP
jgi:carboxyl-terminal processing protease